MRKNWEEEVACQIKRYDNNNHKNNNSDSDADIWWVSLDFFWKHAKDLFRDVVKCYKSYWTCEIKGLSTGA